MKKRLIKKKGKKSNAINKTKNIFRRNKPNRKNSNKSKVQVSIKNSRGKSNTRKNKPKIKQRKYGNFLVTFTAVRSYTYNRATELEIFTRSIPVLHPVTLAGFRKRYLQWVIEEEMKTFNKIAEDTDGSVSWSSWIYEVKAGEEE